MQQKKRLGLQTKLKVNEPGDIYEREADRVADQVMATPAHPAVSGAPPRIQRFSGQSHGQMDAAPASVDQALASPGRPLEPALRQDMEQRFGHDFSRVRVHSGAAAEQSARDVNAHAYTVGHDIVFGAGRFAPGTHEGRQLIAHELTHVVQQSGSDGIRFDQSDEKRGLSSISQPVAEGRAVAGSVQRAPAVSGPKPLDNLVASAEQFLARFLIGDFCDVEGLAQGLSWYCMTQQSPYTFVRAVFHALPKKWEDDVAEAFVKLQPNSRLEHFALTLEGRAMLDVLYDAMITGYVTSFEEEQEMLEKYRQHLGWDIQFTGDKEALKGSKQNESSWPERGIFRWKISWHKRRARKRQ